MAASHAYRRPYPYRSMMHIVDFPYFRKIYKLPILSFNLRFVLNLRFFASPYFDHDHALHVLDAPAHAGSRNGSVLAKATVRSYAKTVTIEKYQSTNRTIIFSDCSLQGRPSPLRQ